MDVAPSYFSFYLKIIDQLLVSGTISNRMKVLAVCGGETDMKAFQRYGFTDVTIANLDSRMVGSSFQPYHWSFQDAEALSFADDSFDLVVICAGLHHCHSPHRALLEAYRVARRCAVALEASDGLLSRVGVRFGVVDEYEVTAVVGNQYAFGGVKNSPTPNYIYRWTKRELIKTIASYAPHARPRILWFHEFKPPVEILKVRKTIKGLVILYAAYPALWLLTKVFKSECNFFGFAVLKPDLPKDLQPWMKLEGNNPVISREWARQRFKESNSKTTAAK